ncbi:MULTISPECIES: hypothetical protein [Streptomyces]|uniref:Integral membrane protein n=1 Tax=Streptomyces yunnanensis TaxID=156453 RepID=A0A9X8MYT2_9ACTN|nr:MULTISPECIES: hypothetical protein [Streptomyces]SHM34875.1 hypothetical protein SAMN05216268_110138 [Streptomyces yunnanensis]
MPDRRRRAALLLPPPAIAGWHPQPTTAPGLVLLPRERKSSSNPDGPSDGTPGPSTSAGQDDNPFAPPPADAPDQEWRPRPHLTGQAQGDAGDGEEQRPQDQPPAWGSQWSSRQPGRQGGGFGSRPGRGGGQGGQGGPGGPGGGGPGGLRWDPTDPLQRRARYALLAGMWAFFFVLFSLPEVALLLGSLSLYWGISALRGKPVPKKAGAAAPGGSPAGGATPPPPGRPGGVAGPSTRPQTTAAIAGLVTASLALMMVAATFTVQVVYRDYFTCVNDALTQSASKSCESLLPPQLRPLLSQQPQQ